MADGGRQVVPMLRLARPLLEDFAYVAKRMRADERAQFVAMSGLPEYDADVCARAGANTPGASYAYVDRAGYPVLLGGFEPLRPGVYEGWHMATADGWERYGAAFHRLSIRLMNDLFAQGAHRIQTCALESRVLAHAWYERIGMKNEGVLAGYCTNGSNAVMFARTRKE